MSFFFAIVSSLAVIIGLMIWTYRIGLSHWDRKIATGFQITWTLILSFLGVSSVLADFSTFPPPFLFFLLGQFALVLFVIKSPVGTRLMEHSSMRLLIGLQGFRILPEILLDLAWRDGLAPIQMTFHGRNFDLLSAILALVLAIAWPRIQRPEVMGWLFTLVGGGLLFNILAIAILSAPLPIRIFMNEPANTFVTQFPYIGLPGIHVFTALLLHGLLIRKLMDRKGSPI